MSSFFKRSVKLDLAFNQAMLNQMQAELTLAKFVIADARKLANLADGPNNCSCKRCRLARSIRAFDECVG